MQGAKPPVYEFGEFRLDGSRRRLLRAGEPVALTPKVFDTLVYLVEHRGTVLSKDELMAALWPDTVVEENNLGQNISKLRALLGESRGENRYIATVPGNGYRFVAEVHAIAEGNEASPAGAVLRAPFTEPPEAERGEHKRGISGWPLGVVIPVLVAALGFFAFHLLRGRTGDSVTVRTIAVLPFKPLVPESRDEALELGMAQTLITRLSSIRDLSVRPLGVVRRYGGPEQNPVTAGRELGVEAVLDGHIQRRGDRIRVTVRLVSVAGEKQLWAGQFDEQFTNIFGVQDSISEKVTRELALELTGEEQDRLARRDTGDAKAYELYLRGRFFISLAQPGRAIDLFQQAIRLDPGYALAHAGLADIYSRVPIATDGSSREAMPIARKAAMRALEIDDRLAEAYAALGWIGFYYDWDWTASEANHRRALEINPDDFSAHLGYAHLLSNTGRHDDALREVDHAVRLDPHSSIASTLKGSFLFQARRYPEAVEHTRTTLENHPTFWIALLQRARSYEHEGRYEEAIATFRKAQEHGSTPSSLSAIGFTYAASGRREEAELTLRELEALSESRYVPPYHLALVHHGLGQTADAMKWLERAYDERDARMVFLGVDSRWDALRRDPRFARLAKRMNLTK